MVEQTNTTVLTIADVNNETDASDLILNIDAFIRAINVNKKTPHAMFLGAGASISSGVPSAARCIWEWKREIFLTNNPGLKEQFSELSLESVQTRIQDWLDKQGSYPPNGDDSEYSFYIEECYPISDNRRAFFLEHTQKAVPYLGYYVLCLLAQESLIHSTYTTNFDSLVSKVASNFNITPIEIGMDSQARIQRPPSKGELPCIALHGDYRYDPLKNTKSELKQQETALRKGLTETAKSMPMIVLGYSGRDHSIMEAFHDAYSQPGSGTLYWCGHGGGDIPPVVKELLLQARKNGRGAYYVRAKGFDETMERLALHCLENDSLKQAKQVIAQFGTDIERVKSQFSPISGTSIGLIKSNAFELDCPKEIMQCELKNWPEDGTWKWLREVTKDKPIIAAPLKGRILFFGDNKTAQEVFGENIKSAIERSPISGSDTKYEDSVVISMIRRALVWSLADHSKFPSDQDREIWLPNAYKSFEQNRVKYKCHHSVLIHIGKLGRKTYVMLMPSVKVVDEQGNTAPPEVSKLTRNTELSGQYNQQFNDAVNKWRKRFFNTKSPWAEFSFPVGSSTPVSLRVQKNPIFAEVLSSAKQVRPIQIEDKLRPLIKHTGFEVPEPKLKFSNAAANATYTDIHPVRGIIKAKPYDYSITSTGLMPKIKIGVICPEGTSKKFSQALQNIKTKHSARDKEREYLFDYPGFDNAYGTPLDLPTEGDASWQECLHPQNSNPIQAVREAAQNIIKSIDVLAATQSPNVIVIIIPDSWQPFKGFKTETENFDLHDYIKAYAVQRGIATQFIEEETLFRSFSPCRVWWWLSLALYAKSMRTPWVLDGVDKDTAYVGLGFSIDHFAPKGQQILLGCSHIYNHQGQGLQYRLSKIENPVWRRRNAFMSLEDARRTGETIRELFYEERMKLPQRVVVHKNTPFLPDEQTGLKEGLSGVSQIDMVQVEFHSALRCLSSCFTRGSFQDGKFPVNRGTVLQIDDYSAMLWTHGSTKIMDNNRTYYQGKRRIPTPLRIIKHSGPSDLNLVAGEIMGLTKMNWNSFDLYDQLPATIQSSGKIARIGSLLKRFDNISYDYRLFF